MTEVTVICKDNVTHTKFMVYANGKAFPEDNYRIARGWYLDGLVREGSLWIMEDIERARAGEEGEKHHAS